jgi:hypothetical protein
MLSSVLPRQQFSFVYLLVLLNHSTPSVLKQVTQLFLDTEVSVTKIHLDTSASRQS